MAEPTPLYIPAPWRCFFTFNLSYQEKPRNTIPMPRASKRKTEPLGSNNAKSSRVDSSTPSSRKPVSKVDERINGLFNKYASKSLGVIDPEGIEALCSDLGVDHTDVRILMFAWKLKAERQGYFTQDEWLRGLKALQADTIDKLKKSLQDLKKEVWKPENFEDFYFFAFRYSLTEEKQKCVDIETICVLIDLVLGSKYQLHVKLFTEFLKSQSDYKAINKDQWINFLRFCQEVSFPGLENYDINQAWPVILDNFVDWVREKRASPDSNLIHALNL